MKRNLNDMAELTLSESKRHGHDGSKLQLGTYLMRVVEELSEAMEAGRKNRHADIEKFHENMTEGWKKSFEMYVKDSVEDELADALIILLNLCKDCGMDIDKHVMMKLTYNCMLAREIGNHEVAKSEKHGMRIYLSLPITGHDINERKSRAQYLSERMKSLFPCCQVFNPLDGIGDDDDHPWEWHMARDIPSLYKATHIYFDDGWEVSKGCRLEHAIYESLKGKLTLLPLRL